MCFLWQNHFFTFILIGHLNVFDQNTCTYFQNNAVCVFIYIHKYTPYMQIQLKSKGYIQLAESAKCWLFYQVRGIIQNACYCLFSTDLNKIFHIKISGLQKNPSGPTNSLGFQHFCVFEPFPKMTIWFWDSSFHTEDNWWTHLQLLQKIQTLTDAPEGKTMH